jgi:M6 family metalloprotease-like protein
MKRGLWFVAGVVTVVLQPSAVVAQQFRVEQTYTADGIRLDYPVDGVWRKLARQVMANRARLLAQGRFALLNSALAGGPPDASPTAVTGVLKVPSILVAFTNTDTTILPKALKYDSVYNTSVPLAGRAYTVRTYYEEISNGLFSVQGTVYGWVRLDTNSTFYLAACGGSGSTALNCGLGRQRFHDLIVSALSKLDASVNFSQFDRDGDGVVDDIRIVEPIIGAECGGPGYNAHHFSLASLVGSSSGVYVTNDPDPNHAGQNIRVDSYHVVGGVGGPTCTNAGLIAGPGTSCHELGHGLGLPDLYDVSLATEGIGEWGIMGSGNYTSQNSPTHYDAWSKQQMGWVSVTPITSNGTYPIDPVESSHDVFVVRVQAPNPRGEYFLLENKQAVGADTANMNFGPRPKVGGLLLWHIDSTQVVNHTVFIDNQTNVGAIHGVELTQGDGLRQLDGQNSPNRGDAGDPYPGTANNKVFSLNTSPPALKNSDGTFAGFVVDSIAQVVPNGQMKFRLRFGGFTTVTASDTAAAVKVDGSPYPVFRDLLDNGSAHTIAVDTPQFSLNTRTKYGFVSWSDGLAISHVISGSFAGATYTATVTRSHRLDYTAGANGTVSSGTVSGGFVLEGTGTTLTAVPAGGFGLHGWSGDTIALSLSITLPMGRPYSVTATFDPLLVVTSGTTRPAGMMGYPYSDALQVTGGGGTTTWALLSASSTLDGLTLLANGALTGFPKAIGTFTYDVRAASGGQFADKSFSFTVTAPTLVKTAVVSQLLNNDLSLSAEDQRYLDFLGNSNGVFDVGDFLAWVRLTGATPAPPQPAAPVKGGRP